MSEKTLCLVKSYVTFKTYCGQSTLDVNCMGCFYIFEESPHRCPECFEAKQRELDDDGPDE